MNRILSGVVEISNAALTVTSQPPVFTGENGALEVSLSFVMDGATTDISRYIAEMYLFWPERKQMTSAVQMTVSGNTATGAFGEALTAVAGAPLFVVQLTDENGNLIVACAQPIQITQTRGDVVITTRPPTPSEIVYVGRSPYINPTNNNWMQWDSDAGAYVDTGIGAVGTPNVGSVNGKTGVVTLYGTDISVSTSDSTKISEALAAAGKVETVAGIGVETGTKNIPLTGADVPVSSSDSTKVSTKLSGIDSDISDLEASVSKLPVLVVTFSSFSSLPQTVTNAAITTDMVCIKAELGTPSAQTSDWTVNTDTAGQVTVSGSISGSTTLTLYLAKTR